MDVIKYGFRYWKKYFPVAVIIQICSFLAITADLMIPLLSQLLIDYIIRNEQKKSTGIFEERSTAFRISKGFRVMLLSL